MYIEEHSQGGYMKKNNQGFTLLEMTIVVIIISVIFLLSVPLKRHCRLSIIKDARQLKKLQMRQFLSTRWNMMSIHIVWMI